MGDSIFPVTGFAGNAFRFAFIGNFLIEVIDDALELISATQRVFFFGFRHIASINFQSLSGDLRRRQAWRTAEQERDRAGTLPDPSPASLNTSATPSAAGSGFTTSRM
jgi:hypothetical protein